MFRLSYIIGNPPFVGFGLATQRQKDDLDEVLQKDIKHSKLDYVIGWYVKAVRFIQNTNIPKIMKTATAPVSAVARALAASNRNAANQVCYPFLPVS